MCVLKILYSETEKGVELFISVPSSPCQDQRSLSSLPCKCVSEEAEKAFLRSSTLSPLLKCKARRQVSSPANFYDCCCCSVARSCPTFCDPMDCSTPGLPVPHHLPEFTQVHVHWIGDAIQLSRPLPPPSPFAFNVSRFQGLFQWVDYASVHLYVYFMIVCMLLSHFSRVRLCATP